MPHESSIFQELGFDPYEAKRLERRTQLLYYVRDEINRRGWTQQDAAEALGVQQPRVSDLMRGRLHLFSIDMLLEMLDRLDYEVGFDVNRRNATEDAWRETPIALVATCDVTWTHAGAAEEHGESCDTHAA